MFRISSYVLHCSVDYHLFQNRCYSIDKPHNPLINAGALITSSFMLTLIRREMALSDKFEFVKDFLKVILHVCHTNNMSWIALPSMR